MTGSDGPIGATWNTGPTGRFGATGPTGYIANYVGTSYRDTTTLSFVQNNGTVYYKAALTGSLSGTTPLITNYNELGTILNVPNINFTYISIVYAFNGAPSSLGSPLYFGAISMDSTPLVLGFVAFPPGSSTNIDSPSILEYTFTTPIVTSTPRGIRIAVWAGTIGGTNYVNIRSVVLGFN